MSICKPEFNPLSNLKQTRLLAIGTRLALSSGCRQFQRSRRLHETHQCTRNVGAVRWIIRLSAAEPAIATPRPNGAISRNSSAPTTPPTFPRTESKPDSQESREASATTARVFTGTITQDKNGYVLQTGDQKYKLDDQSKAKEYAGKHVKVQGSLDRKDNVIRVDKIEEAPSM